jgi:hypothetical protein
MDFQFFYDTRNGKKLVVCGGMGGAARAVVTRDCPQAQEVMMDDSHPLAAAFLKDLHSIANSEISELCVEAILIALHGRWANGFCPGGILSRRDRLIVARHEVPG